MWVGYSEYRAMCYHHQLEMQSCIYLLLYLDQIKLPTTCTEDNIVTTFNANNRYYNKTDNIVQVVS